MEKKRLRDALATVSAPNRSGWKVTTNSVAASRFGQQNVSSRGEAMAGKKGGAEGEVGYGVRREETRERKRAGT